MKSILYVGATLMIGASIYGFVDYKQTQNKKEFKAMYVDKKTEPVASITDKKIPDPAEKIDVTGTMKTGKTPVDVTPSKEIKKAVKKKKKLNHKIFSRAPLREEQEIIVVESPTAEVKKTENKEQ